ncbi:MAG: hypothetical protein CMJ25_01615 [Phycisphaerae bacterium]|nr:hypothetical protein [Phycisphaerae bacterium]
MASSRQQLSQREIDAVMRHYRVGQIKDIKELPEGSVYSPKVVLETERGTLLLKRRARGLDMPALVCFGHEVLLGCMAQGLCVPPLLATHDDANSMVQHDDHIYELFVFIQGERFSPDRPAHAQQLGALLAETHRAMDHIQPTFEPVHETGTVDMSRLLPLQDAASGVPSALVEGMTRVMQYGHELAQANARPPAIVHGDWHPGNMIFRADTLVAVCDFDNTRMGSRERELAQGLRPASRVPPKAGADRFANTRRAIPRTPHRLLEWISPAERAGQPTHHRGADARGHGRRSARLGRARTRRAAPAPPDGCVAQGPVARCASAIPDRLAQRLNPTHIVAV